MIVSFPHDRESSADAAARTGGYAVAAFLSGNYLSAKLYAAAAVSLASAATITEIPVVAWTGGDRPGDPIPEEWRLWNHLFLEQSREWREYWGEEPPADVRRTFSGRARYDAYATFRKMGAAREVEPGAPTWSAEVEP